MIGSLHSRGGWRSGWRGRCLSLLLTLSLTLSLIGPVTGLPAKDGYIPVCTGSGIIYIPLAAAGLDRSTLDQSPLDQPGEDRPGSIFESCPGSAQIHAIVVAPLTAEPSAVVYKLARVLPAGSTAASQQTPASFQARAPPLRDADHSSDV